MPEPTRRKRIQIHLSTAIIMLIVAGGLMWLLVPLLSNLWRLLGEESIGIADWVPYARVILLVVISLLAIIVLVAIGWALESFIRWRSLWKKE